MMGDVSFIIRACMGLGKNSLLAGGNTASNCSNGKKGFPISNSSFNPEKFLMSVTQGA